jgi:hypothetical protein
MRLSGHWVVWPPECVTIGRTKPIWPPRVRPFCPCACVCACSCACASGTLPARVVASTTNTIHTLLLALLISFDAPRGPKFPSRCATCCYCPLHAVGKANQIWACYPFSPRCSCKSATLLGRRTCRSCELGFRESIQLAQVAKGRERKEICVCE